MSEHVKANWLTAKDTNGTLTLIGSIEFQIMYSGLERYTLSHPRQ